VVGAMSDTINPQVTISPRQWGNDRVDREAPLITELWRARGRDGELMPRPRPLRGAH
jgi:hypothetical protein